MAFLLEVRSLLLVGLLSILVLVVLQGAAQAEPVLTSYYGTELAGNPTASGEIFDPYGMTAAHPSLPFGTMLTVTLNGRSVTVRVNDRGPFVAGRGLDLSLGAAQAIGLTEAGPAVVNVEPGEAAPEANPQSTPDETTEPSSTESANPTQTSSDDVTSAGKPEAGEDRSSPSTGTFISPGERIVNSMDGYLRSCEIDASHATMPGSDKQLTPELAKERGQQVDQTLYARLRVLRRRDGELGEEDIL